MKTYEVVIIRQDFDSYIVEAEDESEAEEKALLGDAISMNSVPGDSEIDSITEIKDEN